MGTRTCARLGCENPVRARRADAQYCGPSCAREASRARTLSDSASPGFWTAYGRLRRRTPRTMALAPLIAGLLSILLLAGCGGGGHKPAGAHARSTATTPHSITLTQTTSTSSTSTCPKAATGHGAMGACAPASVGLGAAPGNRVGASNAPRIVDRSNNNPCYCGAQIKAAGYSGLIVKANQGTGYIDSTAAGMVASARAAGLATGEYDFDSTYTVAEAQVFVQRLHAAGIEPTSTNTFPATFDVEYGAFSLTGLRAQIAYVQHQGYRVQVYTGQWYWTPHAGCAWVSVPGWFAGYPNAPLPCGVPADDYVMHQYTDTPFDQSLYLGTSLSTFVHATAPKPKPSPFTIYPAKRIRLAGQLISERLTVMKWWAAKCLNPVRRAVCASTRQHLQLLAGRIEHLGHLNKYGRGKRLYRIDRILTSKGHHA